MSHLLQHKKSALLATVVSLLTACAAPEQAQTIGPKEERAAYEFVLTHAYKVQTVAHFCQRLSSVATAQSRVIERQWQSQNWGYVAVANQALAAQYKQDASAYGEMAALYQPIRLYMQANSSLEPELMPMKRDFSARDQRCLRLLNNLIKRETPYIEHSEHGKALAQLAGVYTQAQQPFNVLLDYKQDYNPNASLLGESVFKAQAIVLQQCPQAKTFTLQHQGHNNKILARCDDGSLLAASCDIASCQAVK